MSAKQIEVQIMGQSYILGCPEAGEPRLREAVQRVDAAMCKIRDAGKIKARERIAVLAALNIAFDQSTAASVSSDSGTSQAQLAGDGHGDSSADAQRLYQLVQRLDQALAEDGQLL